MKDKDFEYRQQMVSSFEKLRTSLKKNVSICSNIPIPKKNAAARMAVLIFIILIWAVIYLPFLGKAELQGNESRRILPALEMLETGNWAVPQLLGREYYKKPPLINWLVAASYKITGKTNEASARFVSVFSILAFVLFVLLMPSGWLDFKSRAAAALIYMTFLGILNKGRLIEIEASLAALSGIAALCWLNKFSETNSKWSLWIIPSIFLGMGLLLKGPIILLFYYLTVIFVLYYSKKLKDLLSVQHVCAIIVMLTIFLSWFFYAESLKTPDEEVGNVWKLELLNQFLLSHWDTWLVNILLAFSNFLPWLVFIPLFLKGKWIAQADPQHIPIIKGACLSIFVSFILINLMPGTEERYTIPLLSLSSIIAGYIILKNFNFKYSGVWNSIITVVLGISCFSLISGTVLIHGGFLNKVLHFLKVETQYPLIPASFALLLAVSAATVFAILTTVRIRRSSGDTLGMIMLTSFAVAVIILQYFIFILPVQNMFDKKRFTGDIINNNLPEGETLCLLDVGYQPFIYYIKHPLKYFYSFASIDGKTGYMLMEDPTYRDLIKDFKNHSLKLSGGKPEKITEFKYKRILYSIIVLKPSSADTPQKIETGNCK